MVFSLLPFGNESISYNPNTPTNSDFKKIIISDEVIIQIRCWETETDFENILNAVNSITVLEIQ